MTGEATPGYLYCSTCPTYILKYIPKVKFLFTLRSPLPRAYSEYLNKVADQLTLTLALALALALTPNPNHHPPPLTSPLPSTRWSTRR